MDTSVSDWTSRLISSSGGIYMQYCYVLVISLFIYLFIDKTDLELRSAGLKGCATPSRIFYLSD